MTLSERSAQGDGAVRLPQAPAGPGTAAPDRTARPYAPLLDLLRILAVLGVVCVHVVADHARPSSPVALHVLRSVLSVAVPAFLMISGALNLSPTALRHGTGRFLGRRLRRLLPATVAWTAFYLLVMNVLTSTEPTDWNDQALRLLSAETYPHLYFLPLILGLTIISPLLAAHIGSSARRAWLTGAVCTAWAVVVMGMPYLTDGLLGEPVAPLPMGALTIFLPYIGYYVLGRAAWAAPVSRRTALLLLLAAAPALTAATTWAYLAPTTKTPPGQVLLPTYHSPTVVLLSLALVIGAMALGRSWTVRARAESILRTLGDATFGIFLVHFAILAALRDTGFPEQAPLGVLALIVVVVIASIGVTLLGKRVPGLRAIL